MGVSSSNVTFAQVAPRVGLQPYNELQDIQTFDFHRSRVPTSLFKEIVMDRCHANASTVPLLSIGQRRQDRGSSLRCG